jgi:uncharacterized protein YjbJ (UPF0337 family)
MQENQTQGPNEQIMDRLKRTLGKLTDDEIALYEGRQEEFFGKIEERYGIHREDAEKIVRDLVSPPMKSDAAA